MTDTRDAAIASGAAADGTSGRGGGRLLVAVALVVGLGVGIGATLLLAGGDDPAPVAPTSGTTRDGDPEAAAELPAPDEGLTLADATDPETALRGFLAAEASRDWETSYEYLTDDVRELVYTSPAAWVQAHADFPQVTGYRIDEVAVDEETGRATVQTLTGFEPMLDPVIGLVAARGRTTWTLEATEDGTWRVNAQVTENRPLYPGSEGAAEAVRAWVDTRVACGDASALEASVVGSRSQAELLCSEDQPDEVAIGDVGSLTDSGEVAPLLSAFGPEVFAWARTARVEATTPIIAVLAPVGSEWRVVGVLPAR